MDVAHAKDKKILRNARWLQSNRRVNLVRGDHHLALLKGAISPQCKEMNGFIMLQTATVSALLTAVIKVQGYKRNITQLS